MKSGKRRQNAEPAKPQKIYGGSHGNRRVVPLGKGAGKAGRKGLCIMGEEKMSQCPPVPNDSEKEASQWDEAVLANTTTLC